MTYYGFGIFEGKTHKLSLHNVYFPNDDDLMRCPLVRNNPDNLAASIERYLEKITPGQTRFYCKVMTNTKQTAVCEEWWQQNP